MAQNEMKAMRDMPLRVRLGAGLGTDFSQCPWRDVVERLQDLWDKRFECLNPVVSRAEYEHRYGQCVQILLKLEISIGSEEEIEPRCRQCQKFPVLEARPPDSTNCRDFVACEERREVPWWDSSSRMRIVDQSFARLLQHCDSNLAAHGGELVEEHVERVPFFDVIEKVADRNTRASEDRFSTLNLGINDDQGLVHAAAPHIQHKQ